MVEITKGDITPEFIATLETDLKLLKSKEPELATFVNRLITLEGKMKTISAKISANDETKPPRPGGVLSLEENHPWSNFIAELKRCAENNAERTKLECELEVLTAEQKDITTKIIEIVPTSVRYYKPQIKAKQFTINVYHDRVTLIG
jgi:hypothetical protein